MTTHALPSCAVELGAPVEVGRASGYFWFPSLHLLGSDQVVCEVVLTEDRAQGQWPARLFVSEDRGQSWRHGAEIDSYGPASVRLGAGELLLMPYELWPLAAGDKRNLIADGTLVAGHETGRLSVTRNPVRFLDFPSDLADYHAGELCLLTNGNVLALNERQLFSTVYGQLAGESKYTNFAVVSDDGGFTWRYRGVVGSWRDTPAAPEGPDESDSVRLADGRLLCVFRVGSGREHEYHRSYSSDDGVTWTKPQPLAGVWSVEPQLVRLENGLILLSGGRPGLFLWVCADGEGAHWERVNLADHHNAHLEDPALRYAARFCEAEAPVEPAQSTSYTGMVAIAPDEALVCYDRLTNGWSGAPGPWGEEDAVFCVRVTARRTP